MISGWLWKHRNLPALYIGNPRLGRDIPNRKSENTLHSGITEKTQAGLPKPFINTYHSGSDNNNNSNNELLWWCLPFDPVHHHSCAVSSILQINESVLLFKWFMFWTGSCKLAQVCHEFTFVFLGTGLLSSWDGMLLLVCPASYPLWQDCFLIPGASLSILPHHSAL